MPLAIVSVERCLLRRRRTMWRNVRRITSRVPTYLATMLDFDNPGSLGAFINEPVIQGIETLNQQVGYFDGRMLAVTFSLLRENTLYWNYYIENYLKGKHPSDFDILYWNSDGTNIAAHVHNFLVRNLYLNNELIQPNKIKVNGVGLNLSKVKTPNFFISTQEDHIALWDTCFKGSTYLAGESTLRPRRIWTCGRHCQIRQTATSMAVIPIIYLMKTRNSGWQMPSSIQNPGGYAGMNGSHLIPAIRFQRVH